MRKKIKVIGGLSRKAKINIFIAVFLVFIVAAIFFSVNQIISIIEKREKIVELEEKLSWIRNNNIEILALEKSLYKKAYWLICKLINMQIQLKLSCEL